jgi:hypothetical protein
MTRLLLKRARASRSSGQCQDEDYDVLGDGKVIGRIFSKRARASGRRSCGGDGRYSSCPRRPA